MRKEILHNRNPVSLFLQSMIQNDGFTINVNTWFRVNVVTGESKACRWKGFVKDF